MDYNLSKFVNRVFVCVLLIIIYLPVSELQAQDRNVFRVIVISGDDGNPIVGANVLLFNGETDDNFDDLFDAGATDSDGRYEFERIEPGNYTLRISYVGHETLIENLQIADGDRIVRRITLRFASSEFDEVVVTERRQISTGDVGVISISAEEINRIPSLVAGGDLSSYLQTVPGVVTAGDRGGDLYIRGGNPSQNLVLVDNMQIFKPFHISNLYSAFPGNMVQTVDLYAGGFAAEYSGATSAIIDVTLRNGNMRHHQSSVTVSPYLTSAQYEGPLKKDRQSIMVQGRYSIMDRYAERIIGEKQEFNFYDVTAKYAFQSESVSCNVTAIRTYDSGQIDPSRNLDLSWSNTVSGVRCLGFDERFNYPVDVSVGYMSYSNSERIDGNPELFSSMNDIFLRFDHKDDVFNFPMDYGFFIGFRSFETILSERFSDFLSLKANRALVKSYAQMEYSIADRFRIQPGIALQFTLETSPTFEPRLRMAYSWGKDDGQEVSLATGIYYQSYEGISDTRDAGTVFTVIKANEYQEQQPRAVHGIAGYEINIGMFELNLEGYVKDHQNIPVSRWTPLARFELETALADGFTYGFDTRVELDAGRFYGQAAYGYSNVEYEAVSESLGAWVEEDIFSYNPGHDQRHKLNIIGSYDFPGFTTNVSWEFSSGRPFTKVYGFDLSLRVPEEDPMTTAGTARTLFSKPFNERLPVQHRLDVSVERTFRFHENVALLAKIGANNIYDRNNIFFYNLNTLQRVDQTPMMPYISLTANLN